MVDYFWGFLCFVFLRNGNNSYNIQDGNFQQAVQLINYFNNNKKHKQIFCQVILFISLAEGYCCQAA